MKPNRFNSLLEFVRKVFAMHFAKDEQGVKSLGAQRKVMRHRLHQTGTLDAASGPGEKEMAALVAYDCGNPSPLNKLVQQGYVFGTLQEVASIWHRVQMRDNLPSCGKRESLANSTVADAREAAVANALDPADAIDFSEGADGWFKIAPYGTFRGKVPGRPQVISQDSAVAMESHFNSLGGKLGRLFRGVPIYHGHPDVDPSIWTDDRRLGKITKLDARADGLWGFAEWNSIGEENKREGWWIYPSPRWDAPKGQAQFSPDRLISIGLTNTPRIEESDPIFNSHLDTETNTTMDPKLIRQKLGLAPEATDEEVLAKIDTVTAAATASATATTELATVKTEKDEMENSITGKDREITQLREAHNNSLLDGAVADTRITAADRPAWAARLAGANRETEVNALAALPKKLNGKALDLNDRRQERKQGDDLREQVANAVAKLQKDEGLSFTDAWKKVKRNDAFKPYFDRTEA